jgi:hypothetical protein
VYSIGLLLAVILTITSFWAANTTAIWAPGVPPGLAILAIAQMGVHLVFFLHITTGPDSSHAALTRKSGASDSRPRPLSRTNAHAARLMIRDAARSAGERSTRTVTIAAKRKQVLRK